MSISIASEIVSFLSVVSSFAIWNPKTLSTQSSPGVSVSLLNGLFGDVVDFFPQSMPTIRSMLCLAFLCNPWWVFDLARFDSDNPLQKLRASCRTLRLIVFGVCRQTRLEPCCEAVGYV